MHLCYKYREIFYDMVQLPAILTRGVCRILTFMCEMTYFPIVVTDNLSMTPSNSSSSPSSLALKSSTCCSCAIILKHIFYLHPICRSPLHHQLITLVVAFIMSCQFAESEKQLLWGLYKLLEKMTIIHRMLPRNLTNSIPQCYSCTWPSNILWL